MKKHQGLLHIPDLYQHREMLPEWYRATDVDAALAAKDREIAEAKEAVRKLRHFAGCVAGNSWVNPVSAALEVLALTKEHSMGEPT